MPKVDNRISKTKALSMMQYYKNSFFTVEFIKKDGTLRILNGQYLKNQTHLNLGYVKVKEAIRAKKHPDDCIRNVNLQTLKKLKINGTVYRIRSR